MSMSLPLNPRIRIHYGLSGYSSSAEGRNSSFELLTIFLLIQTRTISVTGTHCWLMFHFFFTKTSRSFCAKLLSSRSASVCSDAWDYFLSSAGLHTSLCWIPLGCWWPDSPACHSPSEWQHCHLLGGMCLGGWCINHSSSFCTFHRFWRPNNTWKDQQNKALAFSNGWIIPCLGEVKRRC